MSFFRDLFGRIHKRALNYVGGVFWRRGRLDDLNLALACWRRAVAETAGSPDLHMYLNILGGELRDRFKPTGRLEDLEEAIRVLERTVAATPAGSPG